MDIDAKVELTPAQRRNLYKAEDALGDAACYLDGIADAMEEAHAPGSEVLRGLWEEVYSAGMSVANFRQHQDDLLASALPKFGAKCE